MGIKNTEQFNVMTDEQLNEAVKDYQNQLKNIQWDLYWKLKEKNQDGLNEECYFEAIGDKILNKENLIKCIEAYNESNKKNQNGKNNFWPYIITVCKNEARKKYNKKYPYDDISEGEARKLKEEKAALQKEGYSEEANKIEIPRKFPLNISKMENNEKKYGLISEDFVMAMEKSQNNKDIISIFEKINKEGNNKKGINFFPLFSTERIVYSLQNKNEDAMKEYAKEEENKVESVINKNFAAYYVKDYSETEEIKKLIDSELKLLKELKDINIEEDDPEKPCGYYNCNLLNVVFTSYCKIKNCEIKKKGTVSANRRLFIDELAGYGIKLSSKTNEKAKQPIIKSMLHEMSMAENSIPEEITITEDDVESARLSLLRKLIDIELDPDGRMEEYLKEKALSDMFS
ncbi:MAG: hypothetical protein IJY83_00285 [Oscillospiraceae bacterium]|nr:hypothetical protein [Oscillospiraceae bacterium]